MSRFARNWRDWLSGGGYLVLLAVGLVQKTPSAWSGMFAAMLALAMLAWYFSLHRLRAITDTPTSRIASAAQGYVELVGRGLAAPDHAVYSPAHRLPCLWYRYRAYVRQGDNWRQTESGESDALLVLDDGSGRCLIDPIDAEIVTTRSETYTTGDSKVEEELLLAGDRLYALGDFTSHGGGRTAFDDRLEIGRILAEWKEDPDELHRRFDLDRNGDIDPKEWQLANQAAHREMAARRNEAMNEPVTNLLSRPRHGRPYLIANFSPKTLANRFRLRAWLHGAVSLASLIGLGLALQNL
jgi:hypothetical protein